MKRMIGLHCFNWSFNGIKENAKTIKESGYDYILVSPEQGQKEMNNEWKWLLQNNKESDVLFYPRKFDNLWCDEQIKKINFTYK